MTTKRTPRPSRGVRYTKIPAADLLAGCGSVLEICKQYKILDERQLRNWIKVYNGHKDFKKQTGGSRMTKGRETTQAERVAVAKECIANGKNYGANP